MRSSVSFALLTLSAVLSACDQGRPLPQVHDADVAPLLAFDETRTAQAGSCSPDALALGYVDDDSAARGRLRITLSGDYTGGATFQVEVQGRAPVTARFEADSSEVLSAARIQDARGSDGEISVSVRAELDCGAALENVFVFEDPIQACTAPTLSTIAGNESVFYRCADRWIAGGQGCGPKGYLLGYGARYAEKFFFETRPRMTAPGADWLDNVLVCLQTDLQGAIHVDSSCDAIRKTAFDQHPRCYAESGFCTLPIRDVLQVPATIDGKDLFSTDGLRQLIGIVPECGVQYQLALLRWLAGRR